MRLVNLLGLGAWRCPECGVYCPSGYYFRLHLMAGKEIRGHGMGLYRASRYMVRMTEKLMAQKDFKPVQPLDVVQKKRCFVQGALFELANIAR